MRGILLFNLCTKVVKGEAYQNFKLLLKGLSRLNTDTNESWSGVYT